MKGQYGRPFFSPPFYSLFHVFCILDDASVYIHFSMCNKDKSMYVARRAEYVIRRRASAASQLMNTLSSKTPHHGAIE
jgi:hypothetical protein